MSATRFAVLAVVVVSCLACGALGCEARVSLGGTCVYDSECGALRCLYGRCRAECVTSVDCSAGQQCNTGVCATPDESCSEGDPCVDPQLACAGSICTRRCESDRTCSGEAVCEDRIGGSVCVPANLPDAGARPDAGLDAPLEPIDASMDAPGLDAPGLDAFELDAALDAADRDARPRPDATLDALRIPLDGPRRDAFVTPGSVRDLCVGRYYACIVPVDGTIWCWGVGHGGELGGGEPLALGPPGVVSCAPFGATGSVCSLDLVQVVDRSDRPITNVRQVICGERNALAITNDGYLYSWGEGSNGQLGRAFVGTDNTAAARVTDRVGTMLDGVTGAALASRHGCAWIGTTPYCWGARFDGTYGQLGSLDPFMPGAVAATAFGPVTAMGMTDLGTCFADDLGFVWCAGLNEVGAMGSPEPFDTAITRPLLSWTVPGAASQVVMGPQFGCALVGDRPYCWGQAGEGSLGRTDVDVAATRATCADPAGEMYCDPSAAPVFGVLSFDSIAVGAQATTACGVSGGRVYCWGSSEEGTAGSPDRRYEPSAPIAIESAGILEDVRLVRVGGATACALTNSNALYCWGSNQSGHFRTPPDDLQHFEAISVRTD